MDRIRHKCSLVCVLTTIVLLLFSNGASAQFDVSPTYHATIGQTTSHSPALVVFNGKLLLAWSGTDSNRRINTMLSDDGVNWGDKVTHALTGRDFGPALAVSEYNSTAYLAAQTYPNCVNTCVWVVNSSNGTSWVGAQEFRMHGGHEWNVAFDYGALPDGTLVYVTNNGGPCANYGDRQLAQVAIGAAGEQLEIGYHPLFDTCNPVKRANGAPARTQNGGFATGTAWTGVDSSRRLNIYADVPARGYNGPGVTSFSTSGTGASMAFDPPGDDVPNRFAVGFAAPSSKYVRVYLNDFGGGDYGQLYPHWTPGTPAVAFFNGKIIVAWRGGDNQINIAHLDPWR